jgi:ribosomal protein L31
MVYCKHCTVELTAEAKNAEAKNAEAKVRKRSYCHTAWKGKLTSIDSAKRIQRNQ